MKRNSYIPGFTRRGVILLLVLWWVGEAETTLAVVSSIETVLGPQDSLILAAPDGSILASVRPHRPRIPASTLKLLTAAAALHHWGPQHRFATDFYRDAANNLIIKGYGDPLLVSEAMEAMAQEIKRKYPGIMDGVSDLLLDDSFFTGPIQIPGVGPSLNPYDAPLGALSANFNTIKFKRNQQGALVSAEPQTPLVPLAMEQARQTGLAQGRIRLNQRNQAATRYCGQLFRHFFTAAGIPVRGQVRPVAHLPPDCTLIVRQYSPFTLAEIIRQLMRYSNNFVANQLLMALGADYAAPPGSLDKGVAAVTAYGEKVLGLKDFVIAEGSGISRQNRLTAHQLMRILDAFQPYAGLLRKGPDELYKTGTLNGIRTRAGYLLDDQGRRYPFAILLNEPGKSTHPIHARLQQIISRHKSR